MRPLGDDYHIQRMQGKRAGTFHVRQNEIQNHVAGKTGPGFRVIFYPPPPPFVQQTTLTTRCRSILLKSNIRKGLHNSYTDQSIGFRGQKKLILNAF